MSDLAIKIFMVENHFEDFDLAKSIMYKYGVAEPYEDFADRLETLILDDAEEDTDAFADGASFVGDIVQAIKFAVEDSKNSVFWEGVDFAAEAIKQITKRAVEAAQQDDEDPADLLTKDAEAMMQAIKDIFGESATR